MILCTKCKTIPFPRGFDATSGLCWTCTFKGLVPREAK